MLEQLTQLSGQASDFLWKNPLTLALLLGTGIYLSFRLAFVQIRGFRTALKVVSARSKPQHGEGELSAFQALSTSLSATVGTGNIAGVATAIALGGPGALFWMWVTAIFGMATKFAEASLALKFRQINAQGEVAGGPMYTLAEGLGMRKLGILFALFALLASFGIGNTVQANSVVDGLVFIWPSLQAHRWVIGAIIAVLVGSVILGGVKRIARVASTLVPFMAGIYLLAAMVVLVANAAAIPQAFSLILNSALNPAAVGAAAIGEAIRWGVARGLFSNEAGLGSSPMAYAAMNSDNPGRMGLVAMLGPFIDTLVICSLTGLVIVTASITAPAAPELTSTSLTAYAFSTVLGSAGTLVVGIGLCLFAYSTMIAWSYYGDRSVQFLFGARAIAPYRVLFIVLVMVGAGVDLKLVWNIADIMNLLMAGPNLLALVLLVGLARRMADDALENS